MKYVLFLACMLLFAAVAHAGCDELVQTIDALDKAIAHQSAILQDKAKDDGLLAKITRGRAYDEIKRLLELRAQIDETGAHQCSRHVRKQEAKQSNPRRVTQGKSKGNFKPAGKMY